MRSIFRDLNPLNPVAELMITTAELFEFESARLRQGILRLIMGMVLLIIGYLLMLVGLGFGVWCFYQLFLPLTGAPLAAVLAGVIALFLASILLLVTWLLVKKSHKE